MWFCCFFFFYTTFDMPGTMYRKKSSVETNSLCSLSLYVTVRGIFGTILAFWHLFSWARSNAHSYSALPCCAFSLCSHTRRWHVRPGTRLLVTGQGEFFRTSVLTWHSPTNSRVRAFWGVTSSACFFESSWLFLFKMCDGVLPAPVLTTKDSEFLSFLMFKAQY